jgi:hypothetical protein
MTDTLTTAANQLNTWDASTPGGYAAMLVAIILAAMWHAGIANSH